MAYRYDKGSLRPPKKLADGRLRADGHLTRTGVFEYLNPDGSTRREYRPPHEVFKEDSLESFEDVVVTDDHPFVPINAANAREYGVGMVSGKVRRDGDHIAATLVINDESVIRKLQKGKVELSCGYSCDLVQTPGVTPEGERYDAIQTNIRGNHVAIVDVGRAGPSARVRMDAAVMRVDVLAEAQAVLDRIDAWNPDQPRAENGQFGEGGGSSKAEKKSSAKRGEAEIHRSAAKGQREAAAKAKAAGDGSRAMGHERSAKQSDKDADRAEREAQLEDDHGIEVSVGGDIVGKPEGMTMKQAKALLKEYRTRPAEKTADPEVEANIKRAAGDDPELENTIREALAMEEGEDPEVTMARSEAKRGRKRRGDSFNDALNQLGAVDFMSNLVRSQKDNL